MRECIDVDIFYNKYQEASDKLLIQDIIMIYNGCYANYNHYMNDVTNANEHNAQFEIGVIITIHPKHIIVSEELYNFISSLRKLYK